MEILVYTPSLTARIKYALNLVLREVLGAERILFTNSEQELADFSGPKINYSREQIEGVIRFVPHGLLQEKDISEQEIYVSKFKDTPVFFATANSALPFDPFAASFYLVSRYEEYLPHISDQHNRFIATESLAFKNDFLKIPVVNIWCKWVKEILLEEFPNSTFKPDSYKFISTVDVDNLYAYKAKGVIRTSGALFKDVLKLDFATAAERVQTTLGFMPDPYDTFEKQIEANEALKIKSIYFMLFAEFAQFDRNISMFSPRMHVAVRGMNDYTEVGIHPSYRSNESKDLVEFEVRHLEEALRTNVTKSRQHFLKMRFPDTFRYLLDLGITDEYSMGYASEPGFRASIATPFTFYDLEMEVTVPLTIHPFMLMDVTFIDYKKQTKEEAWAEMTSIIDQTKAVDGQLITVFHNRVFSEKEAEWQGWFKLYTQLLEYAKP